MRTIERLKSQEILERILSGNFDWNDIDNLFMRLRAYSLDHQIFQEIAHFVAHNMTRDRGISHGSLEKFYYAFKFFNEYPQSQQKLNLSRPIPTYIKDFLIYRVDDCKPEELRQMFDLTPNQLKIHFKALFQKDEGTGNVILVPSNVQSYTQKAIDHMLGFFVVKPLFTSDDLIADLVSVLHKNNFIFAEDAIMAQRVKIVLCVMLLMHQTKFDFGDSHLGKCEIVAGLGSLSVLATIPFNNAVQGGALCWAGYELFTSDLSPEEFCDDSLLVEESSPDKPGEIVRKINLDQDLCLKNSKLSPIRS